MQFNKTGGVGGAWAKVAEIPSGTKVKIITEAMPVEGQFGSQTVAKARFQGAQEAVNININKPSVNALIDAFGSDSKQWIGNVLTAQTEKAIVGGKRVTIMYLVPEGFELQEDDGGYMVIKRKGEETSGAVLPPPPVRSEEYPAEDIDADSIPF